MKTISIDEYVNVTFAITGNKKIDKALQEIAKCDYSTKVIRKGNVAYITAVAAPHSLTNLWQIWYSCR